MRRRAFLGWLSTLASRLLVACQTVPITGRSQLQLLPESEEMRMGNQAYPEIVKKSRISHDPALGQWLPEVLQYYYASPHRS